MRYIIFTKQLINFDDYDYIDAFVESWSMNPILMR